ncbi:MAG: M15 family metallopeptidase [Clostridiales bacterium]|nr:M15 family metallopeptidase [Clostridiales bacterium]
MKTGNGSDRLIRTAAVLLIAAVFASLTGCLVNEESEGTVPSETVASQAAPTATPSPTPTPTPTPTPAPTPVPTPVPEVVEPQFEETWYNGYVDARSVTATIVENPDDVTVLVNKYYALPADYVPDDLVTAPHSGNQQIRQEACDAWEAMYDACVDATGQGLYLVSGYRDYNTQQYLFDRSRNLRGIEFAVRKNAVPGRSEHQLGLALDITPAGCSEILDEFGETTTGQWVNEHCYEYGFVRRYQEQYKYETGYDIEAWHYRYVGVELATYLYENDMSLEAYYGLEQVLPWDE